MNTNLLNQFLFADLLEKHAQKFRRARLESDPNTTSALTEQDLKEAFVNLQYYRAQSLKILRNTEDLI